MSSGRESAKGSLPGCNCDYCESAGAGGTSRMDTGQHSHSLGATVAQNPVCTDGSEYTTNERGGRQHRIDDAFELIDPTAIMALAAVLKRGRDTYGRDNWRRILAEEHAGRAIRHLYLWLSGDVSEDHLTNAFARAMMARALG